MSSNLNIKDLPEDVQAILDAAPASKSRYATEGIRLRSLVRAEAEHPDTPPAVSAVLWRLLAQAMDA